MNPKVKFLTLAALLIAVGVLLPMFFTYFLLVAHVFTNAHTRLVAGFLLPWQFAALVGITTPLLSFFLTGMPPVPTVFTMTLNYSLMVLLRRSYTETLRKTRMFP